MEGRCFTVSCHVKNCEDVFVWVFTRVYGLMLRGEWDDFLAELGDIRGLWGDPWCIRGDFNIIIYPRETRNCFRLSATMQIFSEIEELKLMNGGSFT